MKDVLERLPAQPDYTFRTGVVVGADDITPTRVVVTIADAPVSVSRFKSYTPTAGDVVLVLFANGDGTILGAYA